MNDYAHARAERLDLICPDCLPACPGCGDLCTAEDKWCPGCGKWLRMGAPTATDLHLRRMARLYYPPPPGEVVSPREGMED